MPEDARTIYEDAAAKAAELFAKGDVSLFQSRRQPIGVITGRPYNGINNAILNMQGFDDPRWITREQAKDNNLFVKAGEKSTKILKPKWTKSIARIDPATGEPELDGKGYPLRETVRLANPEMYQSSAFNASQIQDYPPLEHKIYPRRPLERATEILNNSGIAIHHDQRQGEHFNSLLHEIHMKPQSAYESHDQYVEAGLYQMVRGMAHEAEIGNQTVGSDQYEMRDELAFAMAHAILCSDIGIEADAERQREKLIDYAAALDENPFIIMDASKLANSIVKEIQGRENRRVAERYAEVTAERETLAYSSPKVEISHLRSMQRTVADHARNPESVHIFDNNGDTLLAPKGQEQLYSRPDHSPDFGEVFDIQNRVTAFDHEGNMFDVIMTDTYRQLDGGRMERLENDAEPVITPLERKTMLPLDWNGELVVKNAVIDKDCTTRFDGIRDDEAEVYAVCAMKADGSLAHVKNFDTPEAADKYANIFQKEHDRQTGRVREGAQELEGVTFFKVEYGNAAQKSLARKMGMDYFPEARSWGAKPGVDLDPIRKQFEEHDPFKRLAEIEARKTARASGKGLIILDVPKGREEEAQFLGARISKKYGNAYVPDGVNPELLLQKFKEKEPTQTQETPARETFTVPYADREDAAKAGIEYNPQLRDYEAVGEITPEAIERWSSENAPYEQVILTPREEVIRVLESVDLAVDDESLSLTGAPVAVDVANDLPNQKNGMYLAYEDGSCYAKNNLTQMEVFHPAKGYVLTNEQRQEMREQARELLTKNEQEVEQKYDRNAAKLREQFSNMEAATEQTPYMQENGIDPMEGIYVKSRNVVSLPLVDATGAIQSAYNIRPDGSQTTAANTRTVGVFAPIGGYEKLNDAPAIFVANSLDTAATVSKASGYAVAATLGENNYIPVITALRAEKPDVPVIPLGGDISDRTAMSAARVAGCDVVEPVFAPGERDNGLKTFKDLVQQSRLGSEGAEKQLAAATAREVARVNAARDMEQIHERKEGRQQELSRA